MAGKRASGMVVGLTVAAVVVIMVVVLAGYGAAAAAGTCEGYEAATREGYDAATREGYDAATREGYDAATREGYAVCGPDQSAIQHGGKAACFSKGNYPDTSMQFLTQGTCSVTAGPNKVQAFSLKNYGTPAWKVAPNESATFTGCWPYSLQIS
jgi:hypothetical protein